MSSIMDKLNELAINLRSIDNVNFGGCCVVAAYAALALQRLGFAPRIRVGDGWRSSYTAIEDIRANNRTPETIHDWHINDVYFGHVIVEFDHGNTYHFDASGVKPASNNDPTFDYELYKGYLTVDEAKVLADSGDCWNKMFDRNNIPKLLDFITQFELDAQMC